MRLSHLHRRAGEWFVREGLIEEALRHFLAAGEMDEAAALVERHFRAFIDDGVHSGKDLERWVALFSPAAVSQRPALLVAQAYQHLFQWDYSGVEALLDQAEALLRDSTCDLSDASRQSLRGDIATLYVSCRWAAPGPAAASYPPEHPVSGCACPGASSGRQITGGGTGAGAGPAPGQASGAGARLCRPGPADGRTTSGWWRIGRSWRTVLDLATTLSYPAQQTWMLTPG